MQLSECLRAIAEEYTREYEEGHRASIFDLYDVCEMLTRIADETEAE